MKAKPCDILEETVSITAEHASLDGVLAYPFSGTPARAALIVGPHPMMGGRLDNNVVRATARGMAERGCLSLRFEFGGNQVSAEGMEAFWRTGHAPDDPKRADDTLAACAFLRRIRPLTTVAIGYSFGAALLGCLVDKPWISHLETISKRLLMPIFLSVVFRKESQDGETHWQDADNLGS
jgi:alpha/beta superfamily hydrolase